MKKLFSIFTAVLFVVMSFNLSTLNVSAANPNTYYVKYDPDKKDWVYQSGNTWDDSVVGRELYYMTLDFKDGDYVVAEATEDFPALELDFNLGNFTLVPGSGCTLTAKSVKDCYILREATCSVTANVTNGYVYDYAKANFNKDCLNLELVYDVDPQMSVNVLGTCNYFHAHNETTTKYLLWNFKDALIFGDGYLQTHYDDYEINPPAGFNTSTPSTSTSSTTKPSGAGELDEVPKTGQSYSCLAAFGVAVICLLGSYSLKKRM